MDTEEARVVSLVQNWIDKFGPLPKEATHIVNDRYDDNDLDIHKVGPNTSEFWSPNRKDWTESSFWAGDPDLAPIPEHMKTR